jgi:hypothetical protein
VGAPMLIFGYRLIGAPNTLKHQTTIHISFNLLKKVGKTLRGILKGEKSEGLFHFFISHERRG